MKIYAQRIGRVAIDPFDVRTWPDDAQTRHILRRQLHDLMTRPDYTLEVRTKPDGSQTLWVSPTSAVSKQAAAFIRAHRDDLITHELWLASLHDRRAA